MCTAFWDLADRFSTAPQQQRASAAPQYTRGLPLRAHQAGGERLAAALVPRLKHDALAGAPRQLRRVELVHVRAVREQLRARLQQ